MTHETYIKIKRHIDIIEMVVVHTNDTGMGRFIINDMIAIQKEYNPHPKPVDTSCGNCVLELFKDVYRHYKNHPL